MAPVGMVDSLGWFTSPEMGIISLIVFLVLSATLVALCARCHRNSGNAYDVNGGTTQMEEINGTVGTKTAGTSDAVDTAYTSWRDHKSMPTSTLERSTTSVN